MTREDAMLMVLFCFRRMGASPMDLLIEKTILKHDPNYLYKQVRWLTECYDGFTKGCNRWK